MSERDIVFNTFLVDASFFFDEFFVEVSKNIAKGMKANRKTNSFRGSFLFFPVRGDKGKGEGGVLLASQTPNAPLASFFISFGEDAIHVLL